MELKEVTIVKGDRKFMIAGKNLFLTYSRCNISLKEAYEQIKKIIEEKSNKVKNYMLVREEHKESEGYHIHVYIETIKRYHTINPRKFDIKDVDGEIYHGKYEVVKSKTYVWEYMLKEIKGKEDSRLLVSEGLERRIGEQGEYIDYKETVMRLAEDGRLEEGLEILRKENPGDYLNKIDKYTKNLNIILMKARGIELKHNLNQYEIPLHMKKELEKVKESREKKIGKSLIVVGPTGIAKTAYLLVYLGQELGLKVLKVNNLDGLRYYKGEGAIVYDDISRSEVEYLTREQIIALMDSENSSTVSIKHGSIEIPENIQKIWIANIDPYFMNDSFKDGAVVRRVLKVILENKSLIKPIEDNKEKE